MAEKSARRKKNFDPALKESFKLSRTKIDNFLNCPRCFYLDLRLGIKQPGGLPFTLNAAVDHLLKKEFDLYRAQKKPHPLMVQYGIKAVPYPHSDLEDWRNNFRGIQYLHPETNFLVFGAIDDVWIDKDEQLNIVDYKATAKQGELSLNEEWHVGWKRQMEIYQWLFQQNGFPVSDTGYFVYCNGRKDPDGFHNKLEFNIEIHSYQGDARWVGETLKQARQCLSSDNIPDYTEDCDYCRYQQSLKTIPR